MTKLWSYACKAAGKGNCSKHVDTYRLKDEGEKWQHPQVSKDLLGSSGIHLSAALNQINPQKKGRQVEEGCSYQRAVTGNGSPCLKVDIEDNCELTHA